MTNLRNQHGEMFVKPDQVGLAPVRLMIVGESPAENEVEQEKPFVGYSGKILRTRLDDRLKFRKRGITYYITNAVKVAKFDTDGSNMNPTDDEIDKWRYLVHREIVVYDPAAVLMLGHSAFYSVMGYGAKAIPVTAAEGVFKTFYYEGLTTDPQLFFTYHPASLSRQESYMNHFVETLDGVLEFLAKRSEHE